MSPRAQQCNPCPCFLGGYSARTDLLGQASLVLSCFRHLSAPDSSVFARRLQGGRTHPAAFVLPSREPGAGALRCLGLICDYFIFYFNIPGVPEPEGFNEPQRTHTHNLPKNRAPNPPFPWDFPVLLHPAAVTGATPGAHKGQPPPELRGRDC